MTTEQVRSHVSIFLPMLRMAHGLELQYLELGAKYAGVNISPLVVEAVRALIAKQTGLTCLKVWDIPDRLISPFQEASRLPDLRDLRLEVSNGAEAASFLRSGSLGREPVHGFQALERLAVDADVDAIAHILQSVGGAKLQRLELVMDPLTGDQVPSTLARTLAATPRFSLLTTVWLTFPHLRGSWDCVKPLLLCPNLRVVDLLGDFMAKEVGDPEVRDMAQAWPDLARLTVTDCYLRHMESATNRALGEGGDYPPATTLMGLSVLAAHCRHLKELTIPVDARGLSRNTHINFICPSVEWLRFPYSWVDDAEIEVARVIRVMWPNHRRGASVCECCNAQLDSRDERWEKIWRLAGETSTGGDERWYKAVLPSRLMKTYGLALFAAVAFILYFFG